MVLRLDGTDLPALGARLAAEGPVNVHATDRRVRILHRGVWIADTTAATYVWEHKGYPYFYLPWSAFRGTQKEADGSDRDEHVKWEMNQRGGEKGNKWATWKVSVKGVDGETSVNDRVLSFQCDNSADAPAAALAGKVRVEFSSVDAWYEEDTPIHVHPKDPFKRIELLPSVRGLRFTLPSPSNPATDITLAETSSAIHLHETLLPTRFYFPMSLLQQHLIRPSKKNTRTECPYKGEAQYFDVVLPGGQTHEDIIWYYAFGKTTPDCGTLAGMCCVYNEKVDVWIDGVKQERPKSFWS